MLQSAKFWRAVSICVTVAGAIGFLSWWSLWQHSSMAPLRLGGAEIVAASLASIGALWFLLDGTPEAVHVDAGALSKAYEELEDLAQIKPRHEEFLGVKYSGFAFFAMPGEVKLPRELEELDSATTSAGWIRTLLDSNGYYCPTSEYYARPRRDFILLGLGGATMAAIFHFLGVFLLIWTGAPGLAILHALSLTGLGPFASYIVVSVGLAGPVVAIVIALWVDVEYDFWGNARLGMLWYLAISTGVSLTYLGFQWFSVHRPISDLYRAVLGIT